MVDEDRYRMFVKVLEDLEFKKRIAMVVGYVLSKGGWASFIEIERYTGLRQPEISWTLKDLRKFGWLLERNVRTGKIGRSRKEINIDIKKMIEDISKQKEEQIKRICTALDKLKILINDSFD